MSKEMLIGYPKLGTKFTLSSGSWQSAYPLSNALNATYARVARSTNTLPSSTIITATAVDRRPVRLLGLFAHNMDLNGAFRVSCYDATVSPQMLLYQSDTELVWDTVYDTATRLFETENWFTGQYSDDERKGQIPSRPIILPEGLSPNKIVLELFNQTNPAGHIDIGLFEIAGAIELGGGERPQWGATWGNQSESKITKIDGGLQRAEVFDPTYVFQGEIPYMGNQKARQAMSELFRQYGEHTPFMWVPFPDDPLTYLRESKMVTNQGNQLLSFATDRHMAVPLNLLEWKG